MAIDHKKALAITVLKSAISSSNVTLLQESVSLVQGPQGPASPGFLAVARDRKAELARRLQAQFPFSSVAEWDDALDDFFATDADKQVLAEMSTPLFETVFSAIGFIISRGMGGRSDAPVTAPANSTASQ